MAGKVKTIDSYNYKFTDHNFLIPSKNRISILTNIPESEAAEKNQTEWKHLRKVSTLELSKLFEFTLKLGLLEDVSLALEFILSFHMITLKFKKPHC